LAKYTVWTRPTGSATIIALLLLSPILTAGSAEEVTGMVRCFVRDELEAYFVPGLQPSFYTEYANRRAIVAVSIALVK
jgi:hypothetical protein